MSHRPELHLLQDREGKIPSRKVYEDDEILAFHDIHPWAPVHFLLMPKEHIPSMAQVEDAPRGAAGPHDGAGAQAGDAGGLPALSARAAIRIVVNTGAEGGQEVHHLHIHVIGGPRPWLKG